jgi:RHS repeat-associated protein
MKRAALLMILLALAPLTMAQAPQTGLPRFGHFLAGQYDAVNLQNLNVINSIPVIQVPGRGMDLNFGIIYNSLIWQNVNGAWTSVTDNAGNPTWGWTLTPSAGVSGSASSQLQFVICSSVPPQKAMHHFGYVYTEPNGTQHTFSSIDYYNVATQCGFPTGPKTGDADDNSGFYMDASSFFGAKVFNGSGIQLTGGGSAVNEDTNGNYITPVTVNSSETDWTDTVGHTALKYITSSSSVQYEYQDNTGTYQSITVKLQSFNIKTNFACSGIVEYSGTANLPTEIDLPNGQKYLITYEPTPNFSGYYTGRIQRLTFPTGGYYEYDYPTTAGDGIVCADATVNSLTRVINDGTNTTTWTLSRAQNFPNWATTVTAPQMPYDSAANNSVYTFNSAGQHISAQIYQGAVSSQNLKRTVNTTWSDGAPATQITILEDGQTQNEAETSYDSYGNLLTLKEHDWGTNAPGSVLRTTAWTYLNSSPYISANILNRVTRVTVTDNVSGVVHSRTDTAFDEAAYTNYACHTGVPQHNDSQYSCTFTTRGNPTTVTSYTNASAATGPVTHHTYYDNLGNIVQADLDCCQSETWSYSTTTNYSYPDSATRGSASPYLTTSATYSAYTGLVATSTDENSQVTRYTFDSIKRLTKIVRPDNAQLTWSYNDAAPPTQSSVTASVPVQGSNIQNTITTVDGLGRTVTQQVTDGTTTYSTVATQYDPVGHAYKVSNPYTSSAQYWTAAQFDTLGRTTVTVLPDNSQTTFSYATNTAIVSDPAGKQKKSQVDGLGRMTSVWEPDPSNGNSLTLQTTYSYNILDLLIGVSQGVQSRTYAFDDLGRTTSVQAPETNQAAYNYQYNNFRLVTQRTDPRGVITTYGYDTLNRLQSISYNVGSTGVPATSSVSFTYGTNSSQNNNGRLITMTDGVGSESYSYDILGNMTQLQKVVSGTTYATGYAYNLTGELTSISYPSGRVVLQSFDTIGRLCAVGASGSSCSSGTTYANGFSYNPAFQVTGFNYGNGVTAAFGYTPDRLLLQSLAYTKGSTTLFSTNYWYKTDSTNCPNGAAGNNGQIQCITDNVDSGRTVSYSYDALYRLTTAVTNGSANYAQWGLTWTYDRYGNRLSQSATSDTPPANSLSFANPGGAQTNHPDGMCFDANGNLTAESGTCPPSAPTYGYDAENRLVSYMGTGGTYTYDGNSLRVIKSASSTTTVYIFSGSKVIAEYDNGAAPSSPSREYIYSGSALLAKIESGATTYYHPDHLSTRVLTDSSGNVLGQRGHYPYGETWYESGTTTKLKFTSYERDAESTNDYAMARSYINRFGRFSSPDLLAANIADPQSLNRYAYTLNDPSDLMDPTGLAPFVPFLGHGTDGILDCAFVMLHGGRGEGDVYYLEGFGCSESSDGELIGTRGGGGKRKPKDPCDENDPTNKRVLDFIRAHLKDAQALAAQLNTAATNILGLSGEESTYGTDPKIPKTNNYFSLHPPAQGQVGVYPPGTPRNKWGNALAVFPSSGGYAASGQAFAAQWGSIINGMANPGEFAQALKDARYSTNPNFVQLVAGAIDSILSRINCPQLKGKP